MIVSELMGALSRCNPRAVVVGFIPIIEGDDEAGMYCYEMDSATAQEVTDVKNEVSRVVLECDGMTR